MLVDDEHFFILVFNEWRNRQTSDTDHHDRMMWHLTTTPILISTDKYLLHAKGPWRLVVRSTVPPMLM